MPSAMSPGESNQRLATDEEDARECGLFGFRPPCLQRFARPAFFAFIGSLFFFADGFTLGMFQGVLTTMERRYHLSLTEVSLVVGIYCIGGVLGIAVLIVFFSKPDTNRARVIGICALLTGLAIFSGSLPQFIQDPYVPEGFQTSNDTASEYQEIDMLCFGRHMGDVCGEDQMADSVSPNQIAFYVLLAGNLLEGLFATLMYTLIQIYIADCTTPRQIAFYTGIWGAITGLAPIAGIFVTAAFLGLWVDFYRVSSSFLVSLDERVWVGAWWLGFVLSALLYMLPAVPFFGFPSVMRLSQDTKDGDQDIETSAQASNLGKRDSLATVWRVLKNRDCMLACLSQASAFIVLYGYGIFVPKYLEVQFKMDTQLADILTGCLLAPAFAIGYLLAGSLVKRFNIQYRGLVSLSCLALAVGAIGLIAAFFTGCPNDNVAGVFTPYAGQSHPELRASCNSDCACSLALYSPVCDGDGTVYFSACHAGCQRVNEQEYGDCSCVTAPNGTLGTVDEGACDIDCQYGAMYLVALTIVLMFAQFAQLLRLNIVIRCVPSKDRPVALGVYNCIGLIATIPASYMFGAIIDSSCMVWQETCYGPGSCLLYDNVWYRYTCNGVALGFGALCFGSMLIVWKFPSYTDNEANNDVKNSEPSPNRKYRTDSM